MGAAGKQPKRSKKLGSLSVYIAIAAGVASGYIAVSLLFTQFRHSDCQDPKLQNPRVTRLNDYPMQDKHVVNEVDYIEARQTQLETDVFQELVDERVLVQSFYDRGCNGSRYLEDVLTVHEILQYANEGWLRRPTVPAQPVVSESYEDPYRDDTVQQPQFTTVQAQMMVLGYHNTGTSVLTKLLILMGAYAGPKSALLIGKQNKLKYFELKDSIGTNAKVINAFTKQLAYNLPKGKGSYRADLLNPSAVEEFYQRAGELVKMLNSQPVWVTKDPRMVHTVGLWMQLLARPVCVVPYRHPVAMAQRMMKHPTKKYMAGGNLNNLIGAWERGMMTVLRECRGQPTVFVPTDLMDVPLHKIMLGYLVKELTRAGVPGISYPRKEFLHQHFEQYFDSNRSMVAGDKYNKILQSCAAYEDLQVKDVQNTIKQVASCDISSILEQGSSIMSEYSSCVKSVEGSEVQQYEYVGKLSYFKPLLSPSQFSIVQAIEQTLFSAFKDELDIPSASMADHVLELAARTLKDRFIDNRYGSSE